MGSPRTGSPRPLTPISRWSRNCCLSPSLGAVIVTGICGLVAHFGRPLGYAHFFGGGDGEAIALSTNRRRLSPSVLVVESASRSRGLHRRWSDLCRHRCRGARVGDRWIARHGSSRPRSACRRVRRWRVDGGHHPWGHAARVRSYELIAEGFDMVEPAVAATATAFQESRSSIVGYTEGGGPIRPGPSHTQQVETADPVQATSQGRQLIRRPDRRYRTGDVIVAVVLMFTPSGRPRRS